jgi:regulator of replication initiation timing
MIEMKENKNPFISIREAVKELEKLEVKYDDLEKEINEGFSDGGISRQQMKMLKEEVNRMRFENESLRNNYKKLMEGD